MKKVLAMLCVIASVVFTANVIATPSEATVQHKGEIKTLTFDVANMTCKTCNITVRKAIEQVPGVKSVKVSFDKKIATVVLDTAVTKIEDIEKATLNSGYPTTLLHK